MFIATSPDPTLHRLDSTGCRMVDRARRGIVDSTTMIDESAATDDLQK
jgi:hypothetical protein